MMNETVDLQVQAFVKMDSFTFFLLSILFSGYSCSNLNRINSKAPNWKDEKAYSCECGRPAMQILDNKITGDDKENARIQDIPWTVALVSKANRKHPFCGGSVIQDRIVVTAAHCLLGTKPEDIEIWVNADDLSSNKTISGRLVYDVAEIVKHPEHRGIIINDIALLKLKDSIKLGQLINPVCLPGNNASDYTGRDGIVAGWGKTSTLGTVSPKLLKTQVSILDNKVCNESIKYRGAITDYMMCAGDIELGGPDACKGDSGGPLVLYEEKRAILVGIVSWGFDCGQPLKPGVYSRVSYFHDWIIENTKDSYGC